jgi:hypothetical protein
VAVLNRARLRRWLLVAIALLYVVSIPWYRRGGDAPGFIAGIPDWVAVAMACYFAVAVLNAWAWRLTDIAEDPEQDSP